MVALLKSIGKGLLYIIGLPFFLLILSLAAVFGLFFIVFMFFKSIFLFFTGRSLDDDLPEDVKAKEIKSGKKVTPEPVVTTPEENPSEQPYITSKQTDLTIEEAVFGKEALSPKTTDPFETIETERDLNPVIDTPKETPVQPAEDPVVFEEPIEPAPAAQPKEEEIISQYIPHTGASHILSDEEEDEDDDSGVSIIYGDDND